MEKPFLSFIAFLVFGAGAIAQPTYFSPSSFTLADTLRGMLRPERTCYDVTYYDLQVKIDIGKRHIKGQVDIHFKVVEDFTVMQVDLFRNMKINEVTFHGQPLVYRRQFDAVFVTLPLTLPAGTGAVVRVAYEGVPRAAANAPWDGGFVWSKDQLGNPWAAVACEGTGASLWWPCKDHLSDEPDSMSIRVAVPDGLTCASNGNLRKTERYEKGYTLFDWFVSYPINNYNVSVNIGKYAHFADTYVAADGDSLALDYYVLEYNLDKAKTHFGQVKPMLACYERYFGKYPFWRDGFALIETPYLGMEHQSGIAYGNKYLRGYLGGMIPQDMDWDYIVIHESGHEYFGNAVSAKDHCDVWVHESFTTYMEALYVECRYGYPDALRYLQSQRPFIRNTEPIVGPRDVNFKGWRGSDHYFKGSWMLHTLRNAMDDDDRFFTMLRGFYDQYKYTTCTTNDFVKFVNDATGKDFSKFFLQYLSQPGIPKLEYEAVQKGKNLQVVFKWAGTLPGFDMPVKIGREGNYLTVFPQTEKATELVVPGLSLPEFRVATELFYIKAKEVKGLSETLKVKKP